MNYKANGLSAFSRSEEKKRVPAPVNSKLSLCPNMANDRNSRNKLKVPTFLPNFDWDNLFKEFNNSPAQNPNHLSAGKSEPRRCNIDFAKEFKEATRIDRMNDMKRARSRGIKENENPNKDSKKPWVLSTKVTPSIPNNANKRKLLTSTGRKSSTKRRRVSVTGQASTSRKVEVKPIGSTSRVKKNLFGAPKSKIPKMNSNIADSGEILDSQPLPDLDNSSCSPFETHEEECGITHLKNSKINLMGPTISPLSEIVSKLNKTRISNNTTNPEVAAIKTEIANTLEIYRIHYESKVRRIKQDLNEMENNHSALISNINGILQRLDTANDKPVGLLKAVTPKSSKKNLRIATLTKNLNKSAKSDKKMERALREYNKCRQNAPSVFNTPKTDRTELLDMKSRSVSTRLQQQCLMLLDTPLHD